MIPEPIIPIYKYGGLRDFLHNLGKDECYKQKLEICETLGIHYTTLSKWLRVEFNSSYEIKKIYLDKIAEILGVRTIELKSHVINVETTM